MLLPPGIALGAETTAVVQLLNGSSERAMLAEMRYEAPNNYKFRGRVGDRAVEYRLDQIQQIEFENPPLRYGSPERLWFADGTRLSGSLMRRAGSQSPDAARLDLFTGSFSPRPESLIGLTRTLPAPAQLPPGVKGSDVLWTTEGDRLVGRMLRLENGLALFRSELGSRQTPRSHVRALVLSPEKTEAATTRAWVLQFTNGDRLWTNAWQTQGDGNLQCALGETRLVTETRFLRRAAYMGPRVRAFSRIQPKEFSSSPALQGTEGIIVDRAPADGALRLGEREYAFGLFLRPHCEMEYALDGSAERLLADLGLTSRLAGEGTARVAFAVGEGGWKEFALDKRETPVTVALELKGARRLRIRVDSEDPWACGAHVVLGEPVLIARP
jgi:hypothetical protein